MSRLALAVLAGAAALLAAPLLVVVLVVAVAVTAVSGCAAGAGLAGDAPVPAAARGWVALTQQACPDLPAAWIAAVMARESSFRPDAHADDRNGGTWGLLQLSEPVWRAAYGGGWDTDRDRDGQWDVTQPDLHATAGGRYLCQRLGTVRGIRAANPDAAATRQLSELDALLVAHNAGEGALADYPALPASTADYLAAVRQHLVDWAAPDIGACTAGGAIAVPAGAPADVAQAVRTAQAYVGLRAGWYRKCDRLACRLYGHANSGYPTASAHWADMAHRGLAHPGDRCPPVGAFVFWRTSSAAGHVATVVETDGTCRPDRIRLVTNDWGDTRAGTTGGVYLTTLAQIENGWMRSSGYRGWSQPICRGAALPAGARHPQP